MDRPAAPGAAAGGAPSVVSQLLRRLPFLPAWRAGRPALHRRTPAAPDTQAVFPPGFLTTLALGPGSPSLCIWVRASVLEAPGFPGGIFCPVGRPALLQARLAGRAVRGSGVLAAPDACAPGPAHLNLAAGAFASVLPGAIRISPRHPGRPQAGITGAARRIPLLVARPAYRTARHGFGPAASGA